MTATALIHDRLATLADPTRGRILLALEGQELTVGELCSVLSLPQSTVSRHLRVLADEEWVVTRQEGTSRFYSKNSSLQAGAGKLWTVVAEDLRSDASFARDAERLRDVLAQRRARSKQFFAESGESWDSVRLEMFGSAVGGGALLGLLDSNWIVGDLGCGSGHVSVLLAPYVQRVIGIDASESMLTVARRRLARYSSADFRVGELESLPIGDDELDAAVISLVLHHASDPRRVLVETYRVLKQGGRALIIDLLPHEHIEYRERMGHVWLGFSEAQISSWIREAGFSNGRVIALPPDSDSRTPALFVATGAK